MLKESKTSLRREFLLQRPWSETYGADQVEYMGRSFGSMLEGAA
jgi:hypothetical protein